MSKYDPNLQKLLTNNHFTYKWMADICPPPDSRVNVVHKNSVKEMIENMEQTYENGCIFTLPGERRDGMMYVYYSTFSSDEIRKIVALKIFP